jgi:hypothetical protein
MEPCRLQFDWLPDSLFMMEEGRPEWEKRLVSIGLQETTNRVIKGEHSDSQMSQPW